MAVKFHRCKNVWVKIEGHPCWKVQKALDEQGVEYELVKEPVRRSKRDETVAKTGQKLYPWFEFEDGTVYRAESKEMAEKIRAGELIAGREAAQPSA